MEPILLRILLVTVVSLYAIFGALILSHLEMPQVDDKLSDIITQSNAVQIFSHLESTVSPPIHGNRWNQSRHNIRQCVTDAIRDLLRKNNCSNSATNHLSIHYFRHCYYYNLFPFPTINNNTEQQNDSNNHFSSYIQSFHLDDMEMMNKSSAGTWQFADSLLFAFALITTIGYGNVTPKTFAGQMFCIFFAAIGVPLTLLTIADLGKFISQIIFACNDRFNAEMKKFWQRTCLQNHFKVVISSHRSNKFANNNSSNCKETHEECNIDKEISRKNANTETGDSNEPSNRALILLSLFIIYIIAGSLLLSSYEPEMPFFTAVYFNFITLTSIGLGDIVPQRRSYMVVTILYIIIGLALTTIAIEIAADTLKKLHYFRRKIKNFGNIEIWFGGKRLTVRQIIRNFCDQFNVPDTALSNFNIGNFVEQAIEVEAGERPPLRNSKPRQDVNANGENEFFMKVSTSSEMEPELSCKDEPESNYVTEFTPVPSQELGPEPKHEYESEFETTPEYGSEPELEDEIPLYEFKPPREPTPVTVELEPVPDPELCSLKLEQEMDETPYVPEIMEAPESQSLPPLESVQEQPEVPLSTEEREPERNTPAQPEEPIVKRSQADMEILRRKGYSEEAWKRYQAYQSEWNKFQRLTHTLSHDAHPKNGKK